MNTMPMSVRVALAGDLKAYLPESYQLASFITSIKTAPLYALYALKSSDATWRPGLHHVNKGYAIDLEVWEMPLTQFAMFVLDIAPPLALGNIQLADGSWVKGFVCEDYALKNAKDISHYGGWRNYCEANKSNTRFQCNCIGEIRQ